MIRGNVRFSSLFIFLVGIDVSKSAKVTSWTTTLTTSSSESTCASAHLVEYTYNTITGNAWQCNNVDTDEYCMYVEIENNDCSGNEVLEIDVYGDAIDGDTDLMTLFSQKNSDGTTDWFSYANDWDGGFATSVNGPTGGVLAAPNCESSSLLGPTSNIWTMLSGNTNWNNRLAVADGSNSNWEQLTDDRLGYSSPIHFRLENDKELNEIRTYFDTGSISQVGCTYSTTFDTDSGENWIFIFMTDAGTVSFSQFDINMTCTEVCLF